MKKNLIILLLLTCCHVLMAQNKKLASSSDFKKWASTPPMGWNSWDCYGPTVEEHEVKANANYMAKYLKKFGWEYVVVDIRWFVENDKAGGYNQIDPKYVMDQYGRYQPAVNRFPSAKDGRGFKSLADYVHKKGLKFGIHIMRGIPKEAVMKKTPILGGEGHTADEIYSTEMQCSWLKDNYTVVANKPGAQAYYNSIMNMYAEWGVDFIKVDDLSNPYHQAEIELIRKAIDQCGRPIVFSASPGDTPITAAKHVSEHTNMWRMVGDVWDRWGDILHLFEVTQQWYPYISSGSWPDCDMIPLGRLAIRGEWGVDRKSLLTKDEQYTLMSLFTIYKSPLMFGGDLPSLDHFTFSLLTNKEVLRMHKESSDVKQVFNKDGKLAITSRNSKSGDTYLAVFNLNNESTDIAIELQALGLGSTAMATDLWNQNDRFKVQDKIVKTLRPHSSLLIKFHKN